MKGCQQMLLLKPLFYKSELTKNQLKCSVRILNSHLRVIGTEKWNRVMTAFVMTDLRPDSYFTCESECEAKFVMSAMVHGK